MADVDYGVKTLAELVAVKQALPPRPADAPRASLADRFLVPPFSVLDARQGYWQDRKRFWIDLGIQSELGRGGATRLGSSGDTRPAVTQDGKYSGGDCYRYVGSGRSDHNPRKFAKAFNIGLQANKENDWAVEDDKGSGTSIFDPVVCELMYRWFCPPGGRVVDPFAGGSVRGIVAAKLGRAYAGMDLSAEQIAANYDQAEVICPDADLTWVVGDSQRIRDALGGACDFVFSCPPYFNLEVYSDDPRDLSTMTYDRFCDVYFHIVAEACALLRDDRFAAFVVGEVRDPSTGYYRGFVPDTVGAFHAAGLEYYGEMILLNAVGSLPIRAGKQFDCSRKVGKTHQNVLLFVKGDPVRATEAVGAVDVDDVYLMDAAPGAVAICAQDCAGLEAEGWLQGDGTDAPVIGDTIEAYLLVDILRGQARAAGMPEPRAWIRDAGGWRKTSGEDLTYLVGDVPHLNRSVFPDAPAPADTPPLPEVLR